jgi:hypothetical protein
MIECSPENGAQDVILRSCPAPPDAQDGILRHTADRNSKLEIAAAHSVASHTTKATFGLKTCQDLETFLPKYTSGIHD